MRRKGKGNTTCKKKGIRVEGKGKERGGENKKTRGAIREEKRELGGERE